MGTFVKFHLMDVPELHLKELILKEEGMKFSMEVKTGIDIIEVNRIKDIIEKDGSAFLNRVFTEKEIEYCERKKVQKFQSYAARFAAKEAVFKAISGFAPNKYDIEWKNIELLNDINGRPFVNIKKLKNIECFGKTNMITQIDISISHINEMAVASVVVCFIK